MSEEQECGPRRTRVALVTGGTRGIGLAVARTLRAQGCSVLVASRSGVAPEESSEETAKTNQIRTYSVDVGSDESVERLCDSLLQAWGSVDILVNNAANFDPRPARMLPLDNWTSHFNTKVGGYERFIRALVPQMRCSGWGRVINIAGIATRLTTETTAGIINAGVANLSAMVAAAEVGNGITVNTVHPGATETDRHRLLVEARSLVRESDPASEAAAIRDSMPRGTLVQPEEVAALVGFLASDVAGAITGQAIAVDGGRSSSVQY